MKSQPSQGTPPILVQMQDILVVDADPRTGEIVRRSLPAARVRTAADPAQAQLELQRRPPDLLLLNLQINDHDGVDLLARWRQNFPRTEAVALSRKTSSEICLRAWRAGACDMVVGAMDAASVQGCLQRWASRRADRQRLLERNVRLRTVCRQLNRARHEISQQVNLLCHDLVKAYQELAEQLNQTQVYGQYELALGGELEIEGLLRRTMEWLLQRLGPVNAAVFLPDSEQNHTLGAYLNFDTNADSILTDVIAQTLAPQAAGSSRAMVVERDAQIDELFGQQGRLLHGRAWLACGAWHRNECLGTIIIFRNQGESVSPDWVRMLESIGPVLAEKIARAIRVYQRGLQMDDEDADGSEKGPGNAGGGPGEPTDPFDDAES